MTGIESRLSRWLSVPVFSIGKAVSSVKFVRALNNNAGIAVDDNGRDAVIFGKGLAFALKAGDDVPAERVERAFYQKDATLLEQLIGDIPQEHFDLAREIIDYIQDNLKVELGGSLYIALMDHISFIKQRAEQGMLPKNSLTWEIGRYYPEEFHLSQKVVELLEDELDIQLNDDEAASIALHIINAENDLGHIKESERAVKLVDDILQIIRFQTGIELRPDVPSYQRLVVHVKFFVQRVILKKEGKPVAESSPTAADEKLASMIRESYPRAHDIADRVRSFVESACGITVADEETTYLTINVQRVLQEGGSA